MNVVTPDPFKDHPLANALPFEIVPLIVMFAEPVRELVTALVEAAMVNPPRTIVLPSPLNVKATPVVAVEVLFIDPMVNVLPVPTKVSVRAAPTVTVPEPRLRSLLAVFPIAPNVKLFAKVMLLFPAFTTATPLVLLIVPAVRVRVPDPKALALFTFKVPAVRVTPPDAAELSPLKVNVPAAAFIVVRPV